MTEKSKENVNLTLQLRTQTGAALLLAVDEAAEAAWVPMSMAVVRRIVHKGNGISTVDITLPEWLAIEKGFV